MDTPDINEKSSEFQRSVQTAKEVWWRELDGLESRVRELEDDRDQARDAVQGLQRALSLVQGEKALTKSIEEKRANIFQGEVTESIDDRPPRGLKKRDLARWQLSEQWLTVARLIQAGRPVDALEVADDAYVALRAMVGG